MALFTGTYTDNNIDRKGRVSLPAKFRAELPPENSREIYVYPSPTLEALEACDRSYMEQLRDATGIDPFEDEDGDLGWLIEQACNVTIDTGGRIIIPGELMEHAAIADRVVFVGRGHRFLIMTAAVHAEYKARSLERLRNRSKQRSSNKS